MQELGFGNRGDRANWLEYLGRDFAVNADERDRIGTALCFSPAQRERGDIDP